MKRIKSKVVQDFIGTINDKTIYNEDLYYNIESLLDTLWDKLKNIDIPRENELINDFIESISNIYKLSDITLGDIYDAVYTSIIDFRAENNNLIDTEFKECDLTNATLKHTLFKDCICEDSKFIKTNFLSAKLINCTFKNCDCENTDFQNSKMDNVCFDKSDLENANFMNSTLTNLTLDKTITDNVDFTDISLNVKKDYNTDDKSDYDADVKSTKADIDNTVQENSNNDCKSDCNTDVRSIKTDIYNAVQGILKELGFETFETNDIEAKRKIYEQLIDKAKATRKLADNNELLSDLSDEDITNLKMTLNELVSFTTCRRNNLMHTHSIQYFLKHDLKL